MLLDNYLLVKIYDMFCCLKDHFLPKDGYMYAPVTTFSIYTPPGFFYLKSPKYRKCCQSCQKLSIISSILLSIRAYQFDRSVTSHSCLWPTANGPKIKNINNIRKYKATGKLLASILPTCFAGLWKLATVSHLLINLDSSSGMMFCWNDLMHRDRDNWLKSQQLYCQTQKTVNT